MNNLTNKNYMMAYEDAGPTITKKHIEDLAWSGYFEVLK